MWAFFQGVWGTITAALGLAKQVDAEKHTPIAETETEAENVQDKKVAVDDAVRPGADVGEIRNKTGYRGKD